MNRLSADPSGIEAELNWDHTWPFNPDSPVIEGIARRGQPLAIMLVDLTGLNWIEIEKLLPIVCASSSKANMLPLLIVDLLDFSELRAGEFAFDVLPNSITNRPLRPDLDWESYLARRRRLMLEKWKPAQIVRLSEHAGVWE